MTNMQAVAEPKAGEPQIRIFPHSRGEFPSDGLLQIWLHSALRSKGGVYHLKTLRGGKPKNLSPGSIVLFRFDKSVVGEAVVQKDISKNISNEEREDMNLLTGKKQKYEGRVTFNPSSIRLYSPPVKLDKIKTFGGKKDLIRGAQAQIILDWEAYAEILKEVATKGTFVA